MVKSFSFLPRRALLAAVIGVSVLVAPLVVPSAPAMAQAAAQDEATLELLTITTASGAHKFSVEVMRSDEQRARGLMFRRYMPADRGMLFDFKSEQPVMMWMKNTYLPLDMVFIARNGTVINVAENTEPLSERTIPSARPAFAVLELNAGVASKIGLKAGDKIANSLFR